nr:hypothetical protein [Tanacetum cinerariifolium]
MCGVPPKHVIKKDSDSLGSYMVRFCTSMMILRQSKKVVSCPYITVIISRWLNSYTEVMIVSLAPVRCIPICSPPRSVSYPANHPRNRATTSSTGPAAKSPAYLLTTSAKKVTAPNTKTTAFHLLNKTIKEARTQKTNKTNRTTRCTQQKPRTKDPNVGSKNSVAPNMELQQSQMPRTPPENNIIHQEDQKRSKPMMSPHYAIA